MNQETSTAPIGRAAAEKISLPTFITCMAWPRCSGGLRSEARETAVVSMADPAVAARMRAKNNQPRSGAQAVPSAPITHSRVMAMSTRMRLMRSTSSPTGMPQTNRGMATATPSIRLIWKSVKCISAFTDSWMPLNM